MLKWRNFAKRISGYFLGETETQADTRSKAAATSIKASMRVRVFFLNQFFSSDSEVKKTQARIYAKEGDLAYQKAEAMKQAIQEAGELYHNYKNARKAQASYEGSSILEMAVDKEMATLVDFIIANYDILSNEQKHCTERMREAMQNYVRERVTFELDPANAETQYAMPYVAAETAFAVMSAAHVVVARPPVIRPRHRRTESMPVLPSAAALSAIPAEKIEMPKFSNTIGGAIFNPAYCFSSLLNGVSKLLFEYPARGICWAVNTSFGKPGKDSVIATGIKTVLAGSFIALRSVCFAVAKLFSPGGAKETARDIKALVTNKSARAVADSSMLMPERRASVSQFPGRSVAMNVVPGHVRHVSISEKNSNPEASVLKEVSSSNSAYLSIFGGAGTPSNLSLSMRAPALNSPVANGGSPSSSLSAVANVALSADRLRVSRLIESGLPVSQPLTPKSARSSFVHVASHRRVVSENPVAAGQPGLEAISEMASLHAFSKRRFAFTKSHDGEMKSEKPLAERRPQITIVVQPSARP